MSTSTRLAIYAATLAAVFGIGAGIGTAVGPIDDRDQPATHQPGDHQPGTTAVPGSDATGEVDVHPHSDTSSPEQP
jgi:hypothetical protein